MTLALYTCSFRFLNCREVVIAGVGWRNLSKYTKRGNVFSNQTLIKSEHNKVEWVRVMDFNSLPYN